jgi:beta-lactam-binding protein with PASTA domain
VTGGQVDSALPAGAVASTSPRGGANAPVGSVVTLTLSNGQAPAPTTPPPPAPDPNAAPGAAPGAANPG